MSLFADLQKNTQNVKVEVEDTVNTGGSYTVPTDIYDYGVKMAFLDSNANGTLFVSLELALLVDGKERPYRETIYISSKGGSVTNDKGDLSYGYKLIEQMCMTLVNKPLNQVATEKKSIKVYDYDAQSEIPKEKEVFMELLGQKGKIAIVEQTVNKKGGKDTDYAPLAETRDENRLKNFLNTESKTMNEASANAEPKWSEKWLKQNKDQKWDLTDKTIKSSGATTGTPTKSGGSSSGGLKFN